MMRLVLYCWGRREEEGEKTAVEDWQWINREREKEGKKQSGRMRGNGSDCRAGSGRLFSGRDKKIWTKQTKKMTPPKRSIRQLWVYTRAAVSLFCSARAIVLGTSGFCRYSRHFILYSGPHSGVVWVHIWRVAATNSVVISIGTNSVTGRLVL